LLADFDATLARVWLVKPKRISIEDLVEDIPGQTREAVSA
jgi:glutamate synthase (NADPH/NADH) large chain